MRKLPARVEPSKPAPVVELRPDAVKAPTQPAPAPRPAPVKPAVVEPLAPSRYRVQFTASAELHEKLERLSSLMPGVDLASIVEAAVTEKLERLEAKRFGKTPPVYYVPSRSRSRFTGPDRVASRGPALECGAPMYNTTSF